MSSSVSYNHPSLVLGNVADTGVLDLTGKIQSLQDQIEAAQDNLNSLMLLKRSLAMTMNELADMGIDTSELTAKQSQVNDAITKSAGAYLNTRLSNEEQIQGLKNQLSKQPSNKTVESPVDFSQSKLISLPLAADSIKMDSQYFSFGSNMQDDVLANIEKFVRSNTENLGSKSNEVTHAVSSQVSSQVKNHSVAGTLIITASCTYSMVKTFDPLVIDPDKAVAAWNELFGTGKTISTASLKGSSAPTAENEQGTDSMAVVSGACYGASFVGMIHLLKSQESQSGDMDAVRSQLEDKLRLGGWIQSATGGVGVNQEVLKDIQVVLNTQSVSSHISVVIMGAIPSISSSKLQQSLDSIVSKDSDLVNKIYDNADAVRSVSSESEKAVELARSVNIEKIKMQTLMSGLGKIDYEANKTFDINSLMDVYENFVKDNNPNKGVPISFYLKHLSKSDIEALWLNKYYPPTPKSN